MFDKATWEFINSFSSWIAAFGTVAAVVVSLFLARRDKTVRLELTAGFRLSVIPGSLPPYSELVYISITNIGHREAQITNIGWKLGIFKKEQMIQTVINDGASSPLPVRLKDGEQAQYLIPLNEQTMWLESFRSEFLSQFPKLRSMTIKVWATTTIGKTFESKIEKGLRWKLLGIEKPYFGSNQKIKRTENASD